MFSEEYVEDRWAALDRSNNSLPLTLLPAQRDTIMLLMNGKHVLLNQPTGFAQQINIFFDKTFPRVWKDSGRSVLQPTLHKWYRWLCTFFHSFHLTSTTI